MAEIIPFSNQNPPFEKGETFQVRQVVSNAETVRIPVFRLISGQRFRNVLGEFNYLPVEKGSYIITRYDGSEIAISADALPVLYKPCSPTKIGEEGVYQLKDD
ncbi:MAG: hypothetical protein CFH43_00490 [Proteobacteria bacterium]|nr:MAG: hypothetical protein CFH43_00490 [Pseudomonadota bacterium]|tara:strand:- start:730 stop:1038 length:309 start_codon:yes stop_codon:yes gene_type:complete